MSLTNRSMIESWSQFSKEDLAAFGDNGDSARRDLIDPVLFELAGSLSGKKVLDAGCGNGYLSRKLAHAGASVTGIEPALNLYTYCLRKEQEQRLGITYLQADLSEVDLPAGFDKVFLVNVLMDIPDYIPALRNCVQALKKGGEIIISILHPAFPGFEDEWNRLGHVEIREYFNTPPIKQKYGYLFSRPLSAYINDLISMGCVIEQISEPELPNSVEGSRNQHVPQFLIMKARKEDG